MFVFVFVGVGVWCVQTESANFSQFGRIGDCSIGTSIGGWWAVRRVCLRVGLLRQCFSSTITPHRHDHSQEQDDEEHSEKSGGGETTIPRTKAEFRGRTLSSDGLTTTYLLHDRFDRVQMALQLAAQALAQIHKATHDDKLDVCLLRKPDTPAISCL